MLLVWTVTSFFLITGTSWYNRIPPQRQVALKAAFWAYVEKLQNATKLYYALGAFFVIRLVVTIGWLQSVELVAFAALIHYIARTNTRAHRGDTYWLQQALKDPKAAAAFLGPSIPEWVNFPAVERTAWLDQFVANMWKEMAVATEGTLVSWIEWYLDYYRPSFLSKLQCGVVKMGSVPFKFNGVEIHKMQKETILDFHITWIGNPDIRIVAGMGPVEVETIITDFTMEAVLRIGFGPHIPQWPCFAAMTMAFVNKPVIDFKLTAAKMNLDVIPGLGAWLDNFLRDILAWCMVHPKRLIIPMVSDFDRAKYGYTVDPIGTISITILGCENLKKQMMMSPDVYVKVQVVGSDKKPRKTEVKSSANPRFDSTFRFTIYDQSSQILIQVFDKAHLKAIKLASDRLIGEVTVFAAPMLDGEYHQMTSALVNKEEPHANELGTVAYGVIFVPFKSVDNEAGEDMPPPPSHGPPLSARSTDSALSNQSPPRLPTERPPPRVKHQSGVLFITVVQANNLKNVEGVGKSDPYVLLRIGASTFKTPVVKNNLDPVYGCECQLEFQSAATEALEVEVLDWERMGKDRSLGVMTLPLADILRSSGKMKQAWPLRPQGTITMELKLLIQ